MDSKVKFKECDIPTADNFTIHIFSALAQRELELIRERTKGAMDVIKSNIDRDGFHISKQGNKITSLGRNQISSEVWRMGQDAIKQKKESNPNLKPAKAFATALKDSGLNFVQITNLLNKNGFKTSTGKKYLHTSTRRLFA